MEENHKDLAEVINLDEETMDSSDNVIKLKQLHKLTADEETALFERIKKGDISARNELIISYDCQNMLSYLAYKYRNIPGKTRDDLISDGCYVLFKIYNKFNPKKGVRFATYAQKNVENHFKKLYNQEKKLSLSKSQQKEMKMVETASQEYRNVYGKAPSNVELAEYMDISIDKLNEILKYSNNAPFAGSYNFDDMAENSIQFSDMAVAGSSSTMSSVEKQVIDNEIQEEISQKDEIKEWLISLEDMMFDINDDSVINGREIIEALHGRDIMEILDEPFEGVDMTPKEIAEELSISIQRVNEMVEIIMRDGRSNQGVMALKNFYISRG